MGKKSNPITFQGSLKKKFYFEYNFFLITPLDTEPGYLNWPTRIFFLSIGP